MFNDLTGQKFNLLTAVKYMGHSKWLCKCDCGNEKIIATHNLKGGYTKSCGCLQKKKSSNNLIGQTFGKLTVLADTGKRTTQRQIIWQCQCECGNKIEVRTNSLTSGNTMSCGCLKSSQGEFKIAKILDEANINYKREYVFSDLITEKGGYARFDFAIFKNDTLLYLIEYDGETHSKEHANGWNTIEKIEYQKKCDALKTEYCKKHCIPLIRIPYTKFQTLTLNDLILHEEF